MSYSICFLTATLLAGGAPDGHSGSVHAAPAAKVSSCCDPCCQSSCFLTRLRCLFASDGCCDQCSFLGRLLCRLRMLFHRHSCATSCCEAVKYQPPPVPKEPEVKRAAVRSPYGQRDIAKEYLSKVGRADDLSWVIGQLFYIHADGGLWVVRYAPLDKEDRYGGSVVLAAATSMEGFQEGDLVTVHGEMLNEGRASKFLGGPLYRANAVNLNQRLRR